MDTSAAWLSVYVMRAMSALPSPLGLMVEGATPASVRVAALAQADSVTTLQTARAAKIVRARDIAASIAIGSSRLRSVWALNGQRV